MNSIYFIIFFLSIGCTKVFGQIVLNVSDKSRARHARKKEDYTFEDKLKRATEECSYIARRDDESDRKEAIQRVKNEMNNRNVKEFYKEKEEEKKRGKQYYEKIERQVRNKVLIGGNWNFPDANLENVGRIPSGNGNRRTPRPFPQWRNVPAMLASPGKRHPPPGFEPFYSLPTASAFGEHFVEPYHDRIHRIFRRSRKTKARDPFQQGKFKDHNNCFSRCVFARMELVDAHGFPQESILRKAFEDRIDNKKIRQAKIKKTFLCFDELKKAAMFKCCGCLRECEGAAV